MQVFDVCIIFISCNYIFILTIFFSCGLAPAARSLWAGTGVLGCDHPVGLVLLGLPDIAGGDASNIQRKKVIDSNNTGHLHKQRL